MTKSVSRGRASAAGAVDIGSRLELMVDEYLIERMRGGASLLLHTPVQREVALITDKPWEGNTCIYVTVFQDGDTYRMYYQGSSMDLSEGKLTYTHPEYVAYAESLDGIHWERPDVGLFEFQGSKKNNIIWQGDGTKPKTAHGFAPFKDANPECEREAQYKAVGAAADLKDGRLYGMASPDGIRWSVMRDEPIITKCAFDSQNLAFWDSARGEYRAYMRDFLDGCRDIKTATSPDFVQWGEPVWLEYPGAPTEQLYTNQIAPYYRAPHILVGFPTRYVEREWSPSIEALPELDHRRLRSAAEMRVGTAVTDGLFMTSRDGKTFKRWGEAFIRPGLRTAGNWTYGDNYQNWGIVETASDVTGAPRELSVYATEGYWRGKSTQFRRYTLRVDGFVSMNAPLSGGEFVTKPLLFEGRKLVLNISTSAAGSARVEIQDVQGAPIKGFCLDDCHEIIGDSLEYEVRWKNGTDVRKLSKSPVRLRFEMKDADLYSFRFAAD